MKKTNLRLFEEYWSKKGRCIKAQPVYTDGEKLYIKRYKVLIDVTEDNRVHDESYWGELLKGART